MAKEITGVPFFIKSNGNDIFVMEYAPLKSFDLNKYIIIIPPFAEEMNRSRRMVVLQAKQFAKKGFGTIIFDLYGTGDSEGDFGDARWDIWLANIDSIVQWLRGKNVSVHCLLGLRVGALLLMDYIKKSRTNLDKAILWQPEINGEMAMTRFLRLRLASNMLDRKKEKETTKSLRDKLLTSKSLEIAGYLLSAELYESIASLKLLSLSTKNVRKYYWVDLVSDINQPISPVNSKVIESWKKNNHDVFVKSVVGEPFWALQEITLAPLLLDVTENLIAEA
jgi:exosortase A-associated hydrolase 2